MDWRRVFFRCTILRHFLARPRGVLSETYRYEEISLFPKDLNENYHPSDFAEKVVDPKSFRNILTSTLGWTVSFVPLKSSKAPTNYFTPNILRKSWSRLVVSVVHLDALAFPVAAT